MKLNPQEVHNALSQALSESRLWASGKPEISNSTRSARFASNVCKRLNQQVQRAFPNPCPKLRHIYVDDAGKRHPGEWLLDGVWTENAQPQPHKRKGKNSPVRIRCAIECESSTDGYEYHIDLAKLLVVSSDIKLFLAGLNQRTEDGVENYVNTRIYQTEQVLKQARSGDLSTDWYLAFWPSPLMVKGKSLWHHLDAGIYTDNSRIVLYHRRDDAFQLVTSNEYA